MGEHQLGHLNISYVGSLKVVAKITSIRLRHVTGPTVASRLQQNRQEQKSLSSFLLFYFSQFEVILIWNFANLKIPLQSCTTSRNAAQAQVRRRDNG